MDLQAGFAEVEINPQTFPARTYWAPVDTVIDPLFAHAAVFHDGARTVAFLSLDVVIVEREYVLTIREQVSRACPIPPDCIMVCATHNHACPAVVERPWSEKDHAYLEHMVERAVTSLIAAYHAMVPVEIGTGTCYEGRVSFNRRFIMKNGSVISQPSFDTVERDVLFGEGIVDPQVGVLCVRDLNGKIIGMLVNFACHAVHLMGSLSAGFPGVLSGRLKETYGESSVCVFLNGACGNVIHRNYADPGYEDTKEKIGSILADDVIQIVKRITYSGQARIAAASASVDIRYREIHGLERNLDDLASFNVFPGLIERGWYRWSLERLKALHSRSDHETAEIQVLRIGESVFGAVPAEYFSQHSLRIKEQSVVRETFVVSLANGWLGYIPHREAFDRIGGHESTWCISSKMESGAGDRMADAMLDVIQRLSTVDKTTLARRRGEPADPGDALQRA
jgi:neutral ceramidase